MDVSGRGEPASPGRSRSIPLVVKLAYTLFLALLIPVYWRQYGPGNFLWVSDVALLVTCLALWLENRLLASMMALAALLPDLLWCLDFSLRLVAGSGLGDISGTAYMFDPRLPLLVRTLSLFHLPLPLILLWLVHRLGYDRRALPAQTLLLWGLLLLSYLLTDPERNVNLVFGLGREPQPWLPPSLYLLLLMLVYPIVFYLPVHLVLKRVWRAKS
jgi:hypothetical protein